MTPDKLGKYEIRSTLGRGAMGVVYEGWDPVISRRVAVKTVRLPDPSDSEAQEELARFKREAQAAGRLNHPNVVGVFDYNETADLAYIVMEFVEGQTLKGLVGEQERMALPVVSRILTDVLDGLAYCHERGVVHRDIKPANIMITPAGQAKIADFGIARIESSSMTQAGTVLGTPAYMSPEQFMGVIVDARTDIYSTGVLLFQLLTGERPFEGSMTTIMHKVLNTVPPKPSDLAVTAPRGLDDVVARAMARRPEDRFTTATEFRLALQAALAAPQGGPLPSAGAAEDGTVILSTPRPASPLPPTRTVSPAAVQARTAAGGGSRAPLLVGVAVAVLAAGGAGAYFALRPSTDPTTGGGSGSVVATNGSGGTTPPIGTGLGTSGGSTGNPGTEAGAPGTTSGTGGAGATGGAGNSAIGGTGSVTAGNAAGGTPPPLPDGPKRKPDLPPIQEVRPVVQPDVTANRPPPQTAGQVAPPVTTTGPATQLVNPTGPLVQTLPTQLLPVQTLPTQTLPTQTLPTQTLPTQTLPTQTLPTQTTPTQTPPSQTQPTQTTPTQTVTAQNGQGTTVQSPPVVAVQPTRDPPPPTTQTTPPSQQVAILPPAQMRPALAAALASTACSYTVGSLTLQGVGSIQGVASAASIAALRRGADAAAPGVMIDWDVTDVDAQFCPVLDLVRSLAPEFGSPRNVTLTLNNLKTRLVTDEYIIPHVSMPNYPAYLTVDYLVHDGTVVHLYPSKIDPSANDAKRLHTARAQVKMSEPQGNFPGWQVYEPYGRDLIMVVTSSIPLLGVRQVDPVSQNEPTGPYLVALKAAVDAARKRDARISADALVLETAAKQ